MKRWLTVLFAAAFLISPITNLKGFGIPLDTATVKKSIIFLYYPRPGLESEGGTGFLIDIPTKEDPAIGFWAIVTARHIVDPEWAGCPWRNPPILHARVNIKDYKAASSGVGTSELPLDLLSAGKPIWFSHSNDQVDVAVIPLSSEGIKELQKNDVNALAINILAAKEELEKFQVGIGDGIASAGLVPALFDLKRNYPAFKFGKISNVPDEPLKLTCEPGSVPKNRLAWLIAGNFVPGNSGSPVFLLPLDFNLTGGLQYVGPRIALIGLLSGSIDGADLGEMVPAEYIFDIIKDHYPTMDLYRGNLSDKPKTPAPN
jgi:hypothetical protein